MEKPKIVDYKFLQRVRGYFNYLEIPFNTTLPFVNAFHNTIDCWRDKRDVQG